MLVQKSVTAQICFPWKQTKSLSVWHEATLLTEKLRSLGHICLVIASHGGIHSCQSSYSNSVSRWCVWWICQSCFILGKTQCSPERLNPWLSVCAAYNEELKGNAVNEFRSNIWPILAFKNTVRCLINLCFWFSWVHSVANECFLRSNCYYAVKNTCWCLSFQLPVVAFL